MYHYFFKLSSGSDTLKAIYQKKIAGTALFAQEHNKSSVFRLVSSNACLRTPSSIAILGDFFVDDRSSTSRLKDFVPSILVFLRAKYMSL